MAIPPYEFHETKAQFFELEALKSDSDGWITAVTVTIQGIRGGRKNGRQLPQQYRLLIDLSKIRKELPTIWFIAPPDSEIEHMNVFRARAVCPLTNTRLPDLCWGTTPSAWTSVSSAERSLPNLLEAVRQVLSAANPASRAR
jgi:hypothetical protein